MQLDLRLPIGLMFSIFGALLTLFGLFADHAIYARSLGINVNLWWGLVLLVFGLVMLTFALRKSGKQPE
jgi:putative Mn2+ efflux pump MntP